MRLPGLVCVREKELKGLGSDKKNPPDGYLAKGVVEAASRR